MPHLQRWPSPPIAKVYEAISAIADGRVKLTEANEAQVRSSDGTKSYTVRWNESCKVFSSSDNASRFGHYIGYPIIAVLVEIGKLTLDRSLAHYLAGVPWKQLNDRFKRNYERAVGHVLSGVEHAGADVAGI